MSKKIKKFTNSKGFTLIELLVTVSIISILIAAATVSYSSTQKIGRDTQRKSDMQSIRGALEVYFANNNQYPKTADYNAVSVGSSWTGSGGTPVYLRKMPGDPKTAGKYYYIPFKDTLGIYTCDSATDPCITYQLIACLENSSDSQRDQPMNGLGGCSFTTNTSYTLRAP